jgi:hypothetical protein
MRESKIHSGIEMWNLVEFDSLVEFYKYIMETPRNETFKYGELSSMKKGTWSGTNTFDEAIDLFKHGWSVGAQDLTKKLKVAETDKETHTAFKNVLSMAGYQAIVPLYLQGVPNNMVNKKPVPVKNKVITINKTVSCSASVSSKTLMEESVKCFQIIKKIEASGIRVNLNLMMSTGHACVKIRLKSAGEKLNISKLAFPLVHTAMFRRLYFRFIEVYPTIPKNYRWGYGRVPNESEFKKMSKKNEIVLPTLLRGETEEEIVRLTVDELIDKLSK